MLNDGLVSSLAYIYSGAAIISTIAIFSRQQLMISYMFLGIIMGPYGMKIAEDPDLIHQMGLTGIIFLLFLAGLHLDPKSLFLQLQRVVVATLTTSFFYAVIGYAVASLIAGFGQVESIVVGCTMMFSSTLLGVKLMPYGMLHRHHIGNLVIGVLIVQDLLAISTMLILQAYGQEAITSEHIMRLVLAVPGLIIYAFVLERLVLSRLFNRFESVREYLFILSVGWCLSVSIIAHMMGLSYEIGAFIAGVAIASSRISAYLAECLNPLRDFLLVLFFFSIGANLNIYSLPEMFIPTVFLAVGLVIIKPLSYWFMFSFSQSDAPVGWEAGVRLGQASEFSILEAQIAYHANLISPAVATFIQATTLLTFIFSSYWVSNKFETPANISSDLDD